MKCSLNNGGGGNYDGDGTIKTTEKNKRQKTQKQYYDSFYKIEINFFIKIKKKKKREKKKKEKKKNNYPVANSIVESDDIYYIKIKVS